MKFINRLTRMTIHSEYTYIFFACYYFLTVQRQREKQRATQNTERNEQRKKKKGKTKGTRSSGLPIYLRRFNAKKN